ncbi:uncharacterized [Tachysurus ichikawai]
MEDCETFVRSAKRPCSYSISIEPNSGICRNALDCDCTLNSCVLHGSDTRRRRLTGCRQNKATLLRNSPRDTSSPERDRKRVG